LLSGLLRAAPRRHDGRRSAEQPNIRADLSAYKPESGVVVRQDGTRLRVTWPMAEGEHGVLLLQLRETEPLIEELGVAKTVDGPSTPLLRKVNPVTFLTSASRSEQARMERVLRTIHRVARTRRSPPCWSGRRCASRARAVAATVILDGLTAGPFRGDLRFTVYPGCRLVHTEAVVSTEKDACAILYDAGLTSPTPNWKTIAWVDTKDQLQRVATDSQKTAAPVAVRHRTILAEGESGSVAVFNRRAPVPLSARLLRQLPVRLARARLPSAGRGVGLRSPPTTGGATSVSCPGSTPRRARSNTWASSTC